MLLLLLLFWQWSVFMRQFCFLWEISQENKTKKKYCTHTHREKLFYCLNKAKFVAILAQNFITTTNKKKMENLLHMRFYIPVISLSLSHTYSFSFTLYETTCNEKWLEKKHKSEVIISSLDSNALRLKAKCGKLKSKTWNENNDTEIHQKCNAVVLFSPSSPPVKYRNKILEMWRELFSKNLWKFIIYWHNFWFHFVFLDSSHTNRNENKNFKNNY